MTTPPYQPGAEQIKTSYNFLAPYDIILPERDNKLIYPYGRDYGLMLDVFGESLGSVNTTYEHYNRDRVRSKIKCSCTTDVVSAQVTFDIHADAISEYTYNTNPPYPSGTTESNKGYPVKKFDVLMIKPTNNVSAENMIFATVTDVDEANDQFTALAQNNTAIPTLSADEVVVLYAQAGEGGIMPEPTSFTTTKVQNSMISTVYKAEITNVADNLGYWVNNGANWTMDMQDEHFQEFNRRRQMSWMLGNEVTNATLADWYSSNGYGHLFGGRGMFQEIWDRGNSLGYSGLTGPTLDWANSMVEVLDKQRGSKVNLMCVGLTLRQKLQELFHDFYQNGAVSYGIFSGDEQKFVDFDFWRFNLNGYNFSLKTVDVMNDLQTLGASGYPFSEEGFIQPDMKVNRLESNNSTNVGNPLRIRYQQNEQGANTRLNVNLFDGEKQSDVGRMTKELRMSSVSGIELFAGNMWGWIPKE